MIDVFYLQEVDEVDVKMRLFYQSLGGDVNKLLRGLAAISLANIEAFH